MRYPLSPLRLVQLRSPSHSTPLRSYIMSSRALSSRASAVLSALDLSLDSSISGVYDGQWRGSGPEVESRCPATGEVIGRIKTVSVAPIFRTAGPTSHVLIIARPPYRKHKRPSKHLSKLPRSFEKCQVQNEVKSFDRFEKYSLQRWMPWVIWSVSRWARSSQRVKGRYKR